MKSLRTPFLQNTSGWLLLSLWEDRTFHYKVPFSLSFISLKKFLQWVKYRKKMVNAFYVQSLSFSTLKDKYYSIFRKNINNTQVTTKLIALTLVIILKNVSVIKVLECTGARRIESRSVCLFFNYSKLSTKNFRVTFLQHNLHECQAD